MQSDSTLDLLARSSTVCVLKLIDTTAGVRQRARVSRSRARISMGSEISLSHGAGSVKIRTESAADGARQSPRDENSAPTLAPAFSLFGGANAPSATVATATDVAVMEAYEWVIQQEM